MTTTARTTLREVADALRQLAPEASADALDHALNIVLLYGQDKVLWCERMLAEVAAEREGQ